MNTAQATLLVNDQLLPYVADETLAGLLYRLGLNPEAGGVALAVNGRIIRKLEWTHTQLAPNDRVEVVTAKQGG